MNPLASDLQPPASLPPLHPPGRSRTRAAWSALLVLFLFFCLFFFHSFLLRMSVRSALWVLQPVTGLHIKAEKMEVSWGKPIHWHRMTITAGKAPLATQLTFQDCSLKLSSWWRLFFGDHLLISSLEINEGKGIVDLRTASCSTISFWKNPLFSFASLLDRKLNFFPAALQLHDISFLLLTEGERYTVDHLSCTLPHKIDGQLAYESIFIDAGTVHCQLKGAKAKALWDGKKLALRQLPLAEEITLQNFTLAPHRDRVDLGVIAAVFEGLLRADGSLHHTSEGTFIDSAVLGQQLSLRRLSHFLGLSKNLAGTIREGRLTFRGFALKTLDTEASLHLLADNVRLEKRGWASLAVTANLIGRKISLTDFQLKQQENRVTASGEMTLPEEWHKLAQAPFLLKLKATINDASQLGDLVGSSWKNMTGKLLADGEVHGVTNRAEGYLNVQGNSMTAYGVPLNSLKLQLLFQGEKTALTNFDLWSCSDHFECSGVVENKWPHHYEGKASLQSSDLSEKLLPFLQRYAEASSFYDHLFAPFHLDTSKLHGGSLQASWEGYGETTQHEGKFNITFNNLFKNSRKTSGHSEGFYGPEWLSFSSLNWEEGLQKFHSKVTLSSRGIDFQNISLIQDHKTTLSGNAFLPVDATMLFHRPISLSQTLLHDAPLAVHFQCHDLAIEHHTKSFPWNLMPSLLNGNIDATGLLEKPSLHLTLTGKNDEVAIPTMKFNLATEQGEGTIDAAFMTGKNKSLTLQGKIPVALIVEKEGSPLQEDEHWKLGPSSAPLDLKLSLPSFHLDEIVADYFSSPFSLEKGILSGELLCKGTLGQPEPSGELQLQVGSITIGNDLPSLHDLQGRFLFNKDRMELSDASASIKKEKLIITGKTEWHHQKHEYHFSGTHLPLFQLGSMSATGDLNLTLQGEHQTGVLSGNVIVKEVEGTPKLLVTPFLVPPGINPGSLRLITSNLPAPWTIDVGVTTPPEITFTPSTHSPIESINLHLSGNILSPLLEGFISWQHLPLVFPNITLSLLEGSCHFNAKNPWTPMYNVAASGTLNQQKIKATLSKDQTLQVESNPFVMPSTLALKLAFPKEPPSKDIAPWFSQLPYWLREQSIMEPTTILTPFLNNDSEDRNNLGFTGCGIFYHAEIK